MKFHFLPWPFMIKSKIYNTIWASKLTRFVAGAVWWLSEKGELESDKVNLRSRRRLFRRLAWASRSENPVTSSSGFQETSDSSGLMRTCSLETAVLRRTIGVGIGVGDARRYVYVYTYIYTKEIWPYTIRQGDKLGIHLRIQGEPYNLWKFKLVKKF